MTRDQFKVHVAQSIEDSIINLEGKIGVQLPRRLAFCWMHDKLQVYRDKEIVEAITARVFVDAENIYPCVDLGPTKVLEDGSLLLTANRAGYAPRPFQMNWSGREGPFVLIYGGDFVKTSFHDGTMIMETVVPESLRNGTNTSWRTKPA
jgi:hypothetical protein